jgi:hypothetical protein
MLNLLSSTATNESAAFARDARKRQETNCAWLTRQFKALGSGARGEVEQTYVVLLGGLSDVAFRLRVAQSHVRHDLKPSHWSHAVLIDRLHRDVAATPILEISLEPEQGFQHPTPNNGLQESTLGAYDDRTDYPNIALLRLPVAVADWRDQKDDKRAVVDLFKWQRAVLDAPDLILAWLAFVWGVGAAANPLLHGKGIPSSAMIETILNSVGFDLSPGLSTRVSCPESFWQAAKWWEVYYEGNQRLPIHGRYVVGNKLNPDRD